ncbi:hypothetical protein F1737_07615 [Methanoplanus sp. FWC-SCC4]|uniref:Uncharacterized protein n=1 Tax=Methanochimaera problematica TaxID=2609417 RepID=A0AA97FCS2_9EURY|nr:hypothetical protein [Methanoplanus sp. FWC-SCC4]WOF16569.1 hypothetical protein F1737_07615 [Methanoplanus sp. FWC-SCC4]
MKSLDLNFSEDKSKVTVTCAGKEVSVYSHCAYCKNCEGVLVGKRTIKTPQKEKLGGVKKGLTPEDELLNAAMMFNTLIRDGTAIICNDDQDSGFKSMYSY